MDSNEDLREKIARMAYEIYERKGTSGLEEENWLEAERIVLGNQPVRESSQAAKAPVPFRKKGRSARKQEMPGIQV